MELALKQLAKILISNYFANLASHCSSKNFNCLLVAASPIGGFAAIPSIFHNVLTFYRKTRKKNSIRKEWFVAAFNKIEQFE